MGEGVDDPRSDLDGELEFSYCETHQRAYDPKWGCPQCEANEVEHDWVPGPDITSERKEPKDKDEDNDEAD